MRYGPISKNVLSAYLKASKALKKLKKQYGSHTITDSIADHKRILKALDSAVKVLEIENFYY